MSRIINLIPLLLIIIFVLIIIITTAIIIIIIIVLIIIIIIIIITAIIIMIISIIMWSKIRNFMNRWWNKCLKHMCETTSTGVIWGRLYDVSCVFYYVRSLSSYYVYTPLQGTVVKQLADAQECSYYGHFYLWIIFWTVLTITFFLFCKSILNSVYYEIGYNELSVIANNLSRTIIFNSSISKKESSYCDR